MIKCVTQLLLDAVLGICLVGHTGSFRTAGDFIVTLLILPTGGPSGTLLILVVLEKVVLKSTGIADHLIIIPDVGILLQLLDGKGTVSFIPQGLVVFEGCSSNIPGNVTSASGVVITLRLDLFIATVENFSRFVVPFCSRRGSACWSG